jgi:hypothetical protein
MIGGCAIDSNFLHCMIRYHPGYLALFVLSIIGLAIVWHAWKTP